MGGPGGSGAHVVSPDRICPPISLRRALVGRAHDSFGVMCVGGWSLLGHRTDRHERLSLGGDVRKWNAGLHPNKQRSPRDALSGLLKDTHLAATIPPAPGSFALRNLLRRYMAIFWSSANRWMACELSLSCLHARLVSRSQLRSSALGADRVLLLVGVDPVDFRLCANPRYLGQDSLRADHLRGQQFCVLDRIPYLCSFSVPKLVSLIAGLW